MKNKLLWSTRDVADEFKLDQRNVRRMAVELNVGRRISPTREERVFTRQEVECLIKMFKKA